MIKATDEHTLALCDDPACGFAKTTRPDANPDVTTPSRDEVKRLAHEHVDTTGHAVQFVDSCTLSAAP